MAKFELKISAPREVLEAKLASLGNNPPAAFFFFAVFHLLLDIRELLHAQLEQNGAMQQTSSGGVLIP
jgi:hypothetical protein